MRFVDNFASSAVRWLVRLGLGIYFRRIERFDAGQVPESGPVLFASNHPGSLTDSFLIGTALNRRVGFVGTVQLFRWRPVAWLMRACGIIPVNRVKDDPRAMRTVLETFEACYRVLEAGGAVGIFPEGVTYNDAMLRPVKSGTARMALDLEQRHEGKLGLRIVPVGITYSGKERYRSDVLIRFGEAIVVSEWLTASNENRKAAIHALSDEIVGRIRALILQLPELAQARLVRAVASLYLDRLRAEEGRTWTHSEQLDRVQRIAELVEHYQKNEPDRVLAFAARLRRYRKHLGRLGLSDPTTAWRGELSEGNSGLGSAIVGFLGLPIALYGWLHRLPPALVVDWAVRKFTTRGARKAQTPHVSLLAGLVGFGVAYGVYGVLGHVVFGWPWCLLYVASLPLTGIFAHGHARRMKRMPLWFKGLLLRYRSPWVVWQIERERDRLIQEIESARQDAARSG
jgi:1-acyl-sn-glycerol-3-phosphate acyltransferase